ncbi:sodium-dependent phosphate transporter 2-like [Ruditapes philippinarum]|uniref:sodium-dependent phosphate transporter 2-like n=1 Tax=Ruditapes philippinarum TaxID=129788 RepID=UPI00295A78FC|nr:sodium-dependent phosphate transporter 2-like [Ruditapes philippinarum]
MESNKSDCLDTSGLKWFNGASNIPLHICMFTLDYWQLANNDWIWIVVVAFIIAFILAFGIGANDVANSFGSSVGAKVLTLKQACILGTIFEILGAVLIGAKVLDTIRKGIILIDLFPNSTAAEFMVAALSGSCIWMLVASLLKLPVSATHSLVGATIGFSLVAHSASGVNWKQLSYIIGSWFASPLLSAGISTLLFLFIFKIVLSKEKPLEPGLKLLPIFYSFTIASNLFSIFYKGSQCERFQSHHGPLVYSRMLLCCVHCAILSHIRLPNLVSYPSCLSANNKDLIIYRIFISRLQISIRYLHDIFHMVYKRPIGKGNL